MPVISPAAEKLERRRARLRLAAQTPPMTHKVVEWDSAREEHWRATMNDIADTVQLWMEGKLEPLPPNPRAEEEDQEFWDNWDQAMACHMKTAPPWEVREWLEDTRNYEEWERNMQRSSTTRTIALRYLETGGQETPSPVDDFMEDLKLRLKQRPHLELAEVVDNTIDDSDIPDLILEDEVAHCCKCEGKAVVKAKL
ncbi:hypothetical protein R3P38DRAFT_3190313 [Favolaschia claudopus]|uniref:Uncharacterized protein n=1 Tax=Favolaschia claudopus TaxID=2862362 RepID=A0AAW0BPL4_9AGAR